MSFIDALEDYKVNDFEYAHLVEYSNKDAWSLKLYIPKLLGLIPRSSARYVNYVFNNNIFLNAPDCKPATSTRIETQNFITVARHHYRNFSVGANEDGYIREGTKFIVHIMDGNIREMRISDIV